MGMRISTRKPPTRRRAARRAAPSPRSRARSGAAAQLNPTPPTLAGSVAVATCSRRRRRTPSARGRRGWRGAATRSKTVPPAICGAMPWTHAVLDQRLQRQRRNRVAAASPGRCASRPSGASPRRSDSSAEVVADEVELVVQRHAIGRRAALVPSTYRIIPREAEQRLLGGGRVLRVRISSELSVLKRKCGLSLPLMLASSARTSAASARAAAIATRCARRACSALPKPKTSAAYANTPHIARHRTRCGRSRSRGRRRTVPRRRRSRRAARRRRSRSRRADGARSSSPSRRAARCSQRTHGSATRRERSAARGSGWLRKCRPRSASCHGPTRCRPSRRAASRARTGRHSRARGGRRPFVRPRCGEALPGCWNRSHADPRRALAAGDWKATGCETRASNCRGASADANDDVGQATGQRHRRGRDAEESGRRLGDVGRLAPQYTSIAATSAAKKPLIVTL